jgi:YbgC/YbaW family acyl-CoA thioester hydrolase
MRWAKTYDYPLAVQFEDVDFQRVVHHPNYLKYCERARVAAMDEAGYPFAQLLADGFGLVIADVRLTYRNPMVFGKSYWVQSRLAAVSSASFRVRQVIHDDAEGQRNRLDNADVEDWEQSGPFSAIADIVLVHVALDNIGIDEGSGRGRVPVSVPVPFSNNLLQILGIQAIADGRLDSETKTILRSNKVRLR